MFLYGSTHCKKGEMFVATYPIAHLEIPAADPEAVGTFY
jgi:hypothetical protein